MDERKPEGHRAPVAPDAVPRKLDQLDRDVDSAERQLGEAISDNIARTDDAARAGLAERDAYREKTKRGIRHALTQLRRRAGAAFRS
jgi:hypothetical protein